MQINSKLNSKPYDYLYKTIFPRGYGGCTNCGSGNSGGVGGGYFRDKKWKFQGRGGAYVKIPSVVEVWIFSGTTQYNFNDYFLLVYTVPHKWIIVRYFSHTLIGLLGGD